MTQGFAPARRLPPSLVTADIIVEAPPEPPRSASPGRLLRLLPVVMSVATAAAMAVAFFSGSALARNPTILAFPMMMLVSVAVNAATRRSTGRGSDIEANRVDYFGYLTRLRGQVNETAAAQRLSLAWDHPDPDTLWTLIGGPRMWERRTADADFCLVRIGVGTLDLAARLVGPETAPVERSDPITAAALRRFIDTHSTIANAPITIGLHGTATVTIDGDLDRMRGLLRAMICQLAVLHAPDQLLIVGAINDRNRVHWDWLKWLPHNQHPIAADAVGSARMIYQSLAEAQGALVGAQLPHVVVIADTQRHATAGAGAGTGVTILEVGTGRDGAELTIRYGGQTQALECPDQLDPITALICARRLAAYRPSPAGGAFGNGSGWPSLLGLGDVSCLDPITLWRGQDHRDRLCVPIGTTVDGTPLKLDIKEPAENGMGPHGLCVGATGSGKSELLRTVALGMMAQNSPEVLNLLLIDFKGGATFLELARAPHVAAVITNLSDEAPLVARMRDALAGEMNRRQQLLRTAGCGSVATYERSRRAGAQLTALPTLFIIVDEFSELLSQHPDFADMFVAIGRLGRSLGMHLLLASQRLDEGRLRGLEAHLSYRMCLKTLSASESRTVLGTVDAYQLPNTPGAGFLRSGAGELIGFRTAFVSGPLDPGSGPGVTVAAPAVRLFTAQTTGSVTRAVSGSPARSVLQAVLDRISEQGPPAHQVWLPPLGPTPALDAVLRDAGSASADLLVPIGIVDCPFEQRRTPLMADLSGAAGNVAIVGAPQSGKSTALRTLIMALAVTHDPGQVQFYCLAFGGGALSSVSSLPHVGAVAGRAEPQLAGRMIAELESVVRYREAIFRQHGVDSMARYRELRAERGLVSDTDPFGEVFLVVDGWASLRHHFGSLEEPITALAVQGLSFGVHVVLSASRWAELRPSLKDQIGSRIELRLGDPAESELDRKRAHQVPHDSPGRGLSRDGLHMLIALPRLDGIESISGLAEAAARIGDMLRCRHGESAAPPIPLLPTLVDHDTVVARADDELREHILLGLEEHRLQPFAVDFERHCHLLVLGDNECGKTAVLRTLCREIVRTKTAAQAQLLIVDFRRTLLGVVESEHLGGYAMSPVALGALLPNVLDLLQRRMPPPDASQAQLRARSWWSGPDIYVVVDDYDLVANPAGNLALRGNGDAAWFGWPTAPTLERLRSEWLAATDVATQQRIAAQIQAQAFVDVPFLPLGQFFQPTVQSRTLQGGLTGMPLFWNIRRG